MASIKNIVLSVQLTEDSAEFEVQTATPDFIAFDITRAKQKWPGFEDAPFLWSAFLGWHACRRLGLIPPGTTWESFAATVYNVSSDDSAAAAVDVDPTQPAPAIA
jgi:hypothetical protein